MSQAQRQLEMVRSGSDQPEISRLPAGFALRQYEERDRASYWRLFAVVFQSSSRLDNLRTAALPGGFFVVEHEQSGAVVASAVAAEYEREGHADRGSLQWVMADPEHAGKGLGHAVVAAATGILAAGDYGRVYLSTDDFRLPAISLYLKLGWQPLIFAPEMQQRWDAVYAELGRQPGPGELVVERRAV